MDESQTLNKEPGITTFDKLIELQILLKKESAMKELCKIYKDNILNYSYKN